jgi:hypothetical protein
VTLRARWVIAKSSLGDAESSLGGGKSSLGDAESSLGDAESSLGDAESWLGGAKSWLGDAKSSLGDAKSSLGVTKSSLGAANRASSTNCPRPSARTWSRTTWLWYVRFAASVHAGLVRGRAQLGIGGGGGTRNAWAHACETTSEGGDLRVDTEAGWGGGRRTPICRP